MGDPVRYDGAAKPSGNPHLLRWKNQGRLVGFCPEIAGGFAIPRLPAEIEPAATAHDVLAGQARILDRDGADVTRGFLDGAQAALKAAKLADCRHAILMDGSPSCGSGFVYSGRFDGETLDGLGVTAALFAKNSIQVWSEAQIDDLAKSLISK